MPNVETAEAFLFTLNDSHPSINFTMELAANGKLPFLGVEIVKHMSRLETKVYKKPIDTGLLLHYQSHVDVRYKQSLLKTMLNRTFKLSSNWQLLHLECERLTETFSRLHYPVPLLQSTIRDFVTAKVSGDVRSKQTCDDKKVPVRIILPFKDQRSANSVRRQLGELSRKIRKDIHPVYPTRKIGPNIRPKESKPLLLTNNALFTILSEICAMWIMSATHADTCINALKNIRDLPSGNTLEINMGGTQVTYLLDSRARGSARANLTA